MSFKFLLWIATLSTNGAVPQRYTCPPFETALIAVWTLVNDAVAQLLLVPVGTAVWLTKAMFGLGGGAARAALAPRTRDIAANGDERLEDCG